MSDRRTKIAIVGAGLSGATIAYVLSSYGFRDIQVFEERNHLAGNAHTERDPETGVMVHKYGPHIFHTDNREVWNFVQCFADFEPYIQRTKGIAGGKLYSLPINLHTINQFFDRNMSPDEARRFVAGLSSEPEFPVGENFEDAAIKAIGLDLYTAFMESYTRKQWGRHPMRLPASVLKRLPLRFNYDDNAFFHKYQGMPRAGYTQMVYNMLTMSSVSVHLGRSVNRGDLDGFDHVFYSGPIDKWFNYCAGHLPYRTLDFQVIRAEGDFQGCAVINNCDADTPWTRSTEHKHFTPWEEHKQTIVYREVAREATRFDIPFYPIRYAGPNEMLTQYETLAARESGITFVGRLGTFQYLDMDKTIEQAMLVAKDFQKRHDLGI